MTVSEQPTCMGNMPPNQALTKRIVILMKALDQELKDKDRRLENVVNEDRTLSKLSPDITSSKPRKTLAWHVYSFSKHLLSI